MKILLIDDHMLFRESLRRLLEAERGWSVSGDYGDAKTALDAVEGGLEFDLALIDYDLGGVGSLDGNGLGVAAKLRKLRAELPILMVTAGMRYDELMHAVQEEKVGVFLKNEPAEELFLAMRRVARGELWVSSAAALAMIRQRPEEGGRGTELRFTDREREVLRSVLEGLTNKEIGAQMDLSESAVKAVLQKLFEKSGVRSRSQLVRFAIELQPGASLD